MLESLLFIFAAVGATTDDPVADVRCAETRFSRAAESRDRDAFLSYVDPDARFVNRDVAHGREEVAAAWAAFFETDGPSIRWRPAVVEVSADGRLALSRGPYRVTTVDPDGNLTETWGHFISTWRLNDDGVWQVLFDSGADAGMTPSDSELAILAAEPDCD